MLADPVFRPFDPLGDVRVYVRHLPHWRQHGATYFVTFRQGDSIPAGVVAAWRELRRRWFQAHGMDVRWQQSDPDRLNAAYQRVNPVARRAFERAQARRLHEELDCCHGSCVLRHEVPQQILRESLAHFHGSRLRMGDYVIMPNHVHLLMLPIHADAAESQLAAGRQGWELEELLASIKKWTSRRIGQWLLEQPESVRPDGPAHRQPRFWQQESYDRIVRDAEELLAFRRYIAQNPRKSKLFEGKYSCHAAAWLDATVPPPTP